MREALRELKTQGLLVSGRGSQGTTVAVLPVPHFGEPLSALLGQGAERLIELMEIRSAVEIEAAGLAARRATLEDLHRLAIRITAPGEVLSADDDVAFHAAIAAATHNALFERVIKEPVDLLHGHMAAILEVFYSEPGGASALQRQHDAIRLAIRSGNEQRAREAMRAHLDYVARGLAQLVATGRVVRLAIIDLDGTLLAGPRYISERTKRTIAHVREAGVEVVLTSSRAPRAVRPFHQQLGLSAPVIACNGALLWDILAGAGVRRFPVDPQLAADVVQLSHELGAMVNAESDDEWFSDRADARSHEILLSHGFPQPEPAGKADDLLKTGEPIDKLFVDLRELDEAGMAKARLALERSMAGRANLSETTPGIIDIVSPEASKVAMAQLLARQTQVSAEQIIAIGDNDNDVTLLQWAGIGIAMGNATPAAKAAADVVTSSNLRDGVAEALERWVLAQRPAPSLPASPPANGSAK